MFSNSSMSLKKIVTSLAIVSLMIAGAFAIISPTLISSANAAAVDADYLTGGGTDGSFGDTVGLGNSDLKTSIGSIINVALGFLGIVAVVIVLYGGFMWMTARGEQQKVEKAQKVIVQGIIGIAIILSAWAITKFVVGGVFTATGGGTTAAAEEEAL